MKKVLLGCCLVLFALIFVSCASTGFDDSPIEDIVSIVEVPDASSADLFVRANTWMVDAFKSSESVIQYSDKEAGIIKGKFVMDNMPIAGFGVSGTIESTITIETKDGKARITISYNEAYYYTTIYGIRRRTDMGTAIKEDGREAYHLICDMMVAGFTNAVKSQGAEW